jgi:dolichol-phosphate mannosyltransferase
MISVIIPVYSEELVINECYSRVKKVCTKLSNYDYEIIFIDDGSTDGTLQALKNIASQDQKVKVVSFSRNFGHQIALTAGLAKVSGKAVFILDADLQDPPELLPQMLDKWESGYDVVYGVRKKRKENIIKKSAYFTFYRILRILTDINIPLDSGDFCLMSRHIVDKINAMPERNRFLRGIRTWAGFKQVGIQYERDKRFAGKSKYSFFKLLRLAFDGMISFSHKPLKIAVSMGFVFILIAIIMIFYALYSLIAFPERTPQGWTSTFIAIVFFAGVQLFAFGILGEYIGRIFDEVKKRPLFFIKDEINFDIE